MQNDIGPASDLAVEALDCVGDRLAKLKENHFTIFLLCVIDSWAKNFIPEDQHAEFFEVMADNVRKLADDARSETSN